MTVTYKIIEKMNLEILLQIGKQFSSQIYSQEYLDSNANQLVWQISEQLVSKILKKEEINLIFEL